MKPAAIHRWLRNVKEREAPEGQPPYNSRGEPVYRETDVSKKTHSGQGDPLYRERGASTRPQFFTFAELDHERSRKENASPDMTSPILAPKPRRHGTVKVTQKPPMAPSTINPPHPENFLGTDCTGNRVPTTKERSVHLQDGEEIDPSGKTTLSAFPTSGGRTRALSRSNAVKRPCSPYAEGSMDPSKFRPITSHPNETLRLRTSGMEIPVTSSGVSLRPGTSSGVSVRPPVAGVKPVGVGRSQSLLARNATMKPRGSKFAERL